MSKRDGLLALAERVEAATGPDRELDMDIAVAIRWKPAGVDERLFFNKAARPLYAYRVPHYSASLDAAMTLVPEGEQFELLTMGGEKPSAFVSGGSIDWDDCNCSVAATSALALTAAALRARAAMEPEV